MIHPFLILIFLLSFPSIGYSWDYEKDLQIQGLVDLRFSRADAAKTWLDRGLGKSRYGEKGSGPDEESRLQMAEASMVVTSQFGWSWSGDLHLKYDPEQEKSSIDMVEGFLRYKSLPGSRILFKGKLGAFFPPVSLENHGLAWTSPYSITPSAINSWVGEEVKTIGGELVVQKKGEDIDIKVLGAIFMANDPAGSLLAWRGWTLHDRKATVFDRMALPPLGVFEEGRIFSRQAPWVEPFHEIDDKPGFYTGINIDHLDYGGVHFLYYDNLGDGTAFDGSQYAWETRFFNVGTHIVLPFDTTLLLQYMKGDTEMGGGPGVYLNFWSFFVLLSKQIEKHRLTARYDRFVTEDMDDTFRDDNNESGWAWLLAYRYEINPKHHLMVEWLSIHSDRPERTRLGWDENIHESAVQVNYRFLFDFPK